MVDVANGPQHDLLDEAVVAAWVDLISARETHVVGFAPLCASFSRSLRPPVRSSSSPWGLPEAQLPTRVGGCSGVAYLARANRQLRSFLDLAWACVRADVAFWVEQPADLVASAWPDGSHNPFYAHGGGDSRDAHLFRLDEWHRLSACVQGVYVSTLQCVWGSPARKPTVFFATEPVGRFMRALQCTMCTCVGHGRLRGRLQDGRAATAAAQSYPPALNAELAWAMMASADVEARGVVLSGGAWACSIIDSGIDGPGIDEVSDCDTSSDESAGSSAAIEELRAEGVGRAPAQQRGQPVASSSASAGVLEGMWSSAKEPPAQVAAVMETVRSAPPRFASSRRSHSRPLDALRDTPFPALSRIVSQPVSRARTPGEPWGQAMFALGEAATRAPVQIQELFLPGHYEDIQLWLRRADVAWSRLQEGVVVHVPTLVKGQECLQPWARGIIWDCRRPATCVPCVPSDRQTVFPGPHIDRARLREWAARCGLGDEFTVSTAGEGGVEKRSSTSLHIVLAWHSEGMASGFPHAAACIDAELALCFTSDSLPTLPFVPCRVNPRNVVMQERARLKPGSDVPEFFLKPRVTSHLSYSVRQHGVHDSGLDDGAAAQGESPVLEVPSVNDGVPALASAVALPTVQDFALGADVVGAMAEGVSGVGVEMATLDITSAYSYVPVQTLDWWQQCFLWGRGAQNDGYGEAGVRYSMRVVFGGAEGPQSFSNVMAIPLAEARRRIREFDDMHPYPELVRSRVLSRLQLQAAGRLPQGEGQALPHFTHAFIDDTAHAALNDRVDVPQSLLAVDPEHGHATRSVGGVPCAWDSRILVHVRILISVFREFGFVVAVAKTMAGSSIVSLGALLDVPSRRMSCPEPKRSGTLAKIRAAAACLAEGAPLSFPDLEHIVGRLCHLAQWEPPLWLHLHAGYAVLRVRTRARCRKGMNVCTVRLAPGGRRAVELQRLFAVALEQLEANVGVPFSFADFPLPDEVGVLVVVTDASLQPGRSSADADDGMGGFALHSERPGEVWVMSSRWPSDVRDAMLRGMLRVAARPAGRPVLSMPVGEGLAVDCLVAAVTTVVPTRAVWAVGDCLPVVHAITSASSGSAPLGVVVRSAHERVSLWMAVWMPRELNALADALSHPSLREGVVVGLRQRGWQAHELFGRASPGCELVSASLLCSLIAAAAADSQAGGWSDADVNPLVCRRGRVPKRRVVVDLEPPSAMGCPYVLAAGQRGDGDARDRMCCIFEEVLRRVMRGEAVGLASVLAAAGSPPGISVHSAYVDAPDAVYSDRLRSAVLALRATVCSGARVALACSCAPLRCHAQSLAAWACGWW